ELPDGGPSNELEALAWLTFDEACEVDAPEITITILRELASRLRADPTLEAPAPIPFYRLVGDTFTRLEI
ncbi:MAG: NUDIX hydrolase, partial [Rhizobiaceae bacterium]|nr:NUDIX hydrolase [Rhizobiaceae bacterium]